MEKKDNDSFLDVESGYVISTLNENISMRWGNMGARTSQVLWHSDELTLVCDFKEFRGMERVGDITDHALSSKFKRYVDDGYKIALFPVLFLNYGGYEQMAHQSNPSLEILQFRNTSERCSYGVDSNGNTILIRQNCDNVAEWTVVCNARYPCVQCDMNWSAFEETHAATNLPAIASKCIKKHVYCRRAVEPERVMLRNDYSSANLYNSSANLYKYARLRHKDMGRCVCCWCFKE